MTEEEKTRERLLNELAALRRRVAELEQVKRNLGQVQENSSPPGKEGQRQGQALFEGLV